MENMLCFLKTILQANEYRRQLFKKPVSTADWHFNVCGEKDVQLQYTEQCRVDSMPHINTLRPRQDGCRFPNDIFKCIFFNQNLLILIKISLKFVPKVQINNIPALVQIMAWRRPGDKPLSGPVMVSLLTHICVTRPQWVNVAYGHFT